MADHPLDAEAELEALTCRLGELERLYDSQSRFVALAAHELRAPAAVVHGISTTLAEHAEELPADELAHLLGALRDQTGRLVRLLDQLLDVSRLDAQATSTERRTLPIRERAERLVESVAGERTEEVQLDIAADLEATLDPEAFDRIVANLVTNALRHGAAPVRVHADQLDRHFRLTVEDRGDGVAPDFEGRLFERFSRDDSGGSGLGLAIAQQYAVANGGRIVYEPAEPHGARFRLVLPAPRAPHQTLLQ